MTRMLGEGFDVEANMTEDSHRLGYTPTVWAIVNHQPEVRSKNELTINEPTTEHDKQETETGAQANELRACP